MTYALWNTTTGAITLFDAVRALFESASASPMIDISASGDRVAFVDLDLVRVIDGHSGKELATKRPRDESGSSVAGLALAPDGRRILLRWSDDTLRVYEVETFKEAFRSEAGAQVSDADFLEPDGAYATGRPGLVRLPIV